MASDVINLIYLYTNLVNGKVYIGQTWNSLKERAGANGCCYGGCTHFWNAIKKYGWHNFQGQVLVVVNTQEVADHWEEYFIAYYDSRNPTKGYNLASGGSRGKMPEETRKKMSDSHRGEKNYNYGTTMPQATRDKISQANKGRKWSENEHKRRAEQYSYYSERITGDKNPMFGQKWSDDKKKQMSEAFTGEGNPFFGKRHSEEFKRQISQTKKTFSDDQDTQILNEYLYTLKSMQDIADEYSVGIKVIFNIVRKSGKEKDKGLIEKSKKVGVIKKLTAQQVLAIFQDARSYKQIAMDFGITKSTVSEIKCGKSRSDITGKQYKRKKCIKE
jgi:predicted DNA-binding protein YlxM (UPF0122 family)